MGKAWLMGLGAALMLYSATGAAQTIAGLYQTGHQVDSLQLCDSGRGYLLRDSSVLRQLRQQVRRLQTRQNPFPMLYVRLEGSVKPSAEAVAVDYDGVMQVQRILSASSTVPEACMQSLGIK